MGALTIVGGAGMTADVATIDVPDAPTMTLGETITTPTTTTSILSFRPSVTATPPRQASPGD